jgi:tetratricopeptide (TPR) repeat protein
MRVPLQNPARKITLLAICSLGMLVYLGAAASEFLAAHFAADPNLGSLQRAVRLQPRNAEYHYRLGRYFSLLQPSPEEAAQSYRTAVALNPHQARYWFALAGAYQLLGNTDGQRAALERAISAEPTTPDVAWEAANFYVVQGDIDKALDELRVVLANDPYLPPAALALCWRIRPDIDFLLRNLVPPNVTVNSSFLDFLISRRETAAAAKVWDQIAQLHQPVERRHVFGYIRYLLGQREPDQARRVWQQAANLSDLSAYQPSAANLVVNGDFNLEILNGGFDWLYRKPPDVSLMLDPTQFHTGHSSLYLAFDSRGIEDAGVRQLVGVQPGTSYQFSAYYKAEDVEGAGGFRFVIQDLYTSKTYFASDYLTDVDFWKQVNGAFTTDDDSKMVVLRVQRDPANSPIKGRLWIDSLSLTPTRPQGASQ